MGVWSFVKRKGKTLFDGEEAVDVHSDVLRDEVVNLGLDASGLEISVQGDIVKVSGAAVNQETKEKVILAVGNVVGVAVVEDDVPSDTDPVFCTVVPGDTLRGIAASALGDGARCTDIFEANKPMLSHPDKIYAGQVLRIPQD